MSTPLTTGTLLEVQLWCSDFEQTSVNTFHYAVTEIGTGAVTDQDVANDFDGIFGSSLDGIKTVLYNNALYRGTQVRIIGPQPQPVAVHSITNQGVGTGGAIGIPRQATGLTSWKTNFTGPKFRGRTYWPFAPSAEDVSFGAPSAAYVTAINQIADALIDKVTVTAGGDTAHIMFGVRQRRTVSVVKIVDRMTAQKWATQKRRGSYGRANTAPF